MKSKTQLRLAVLLVSIGLLYPALRITDSFPTSFFIETATLLNKERADSLNVRFSQEQQLLERASQRFMFGWGRYGRNRVYEEDTGKDLSLTDGAWIQILGQFGIVGFVAQFGLLALPVLRAMSALRFAGSLRDRVFLAALALIVALNLIEQIPNSSMSSWNWLLAGALLGRAEYLRSSMYASRKSLRPESFGARPARIGE
jgi:O-antigen ligase